MIHLLDTTVDLPSWSKYGLFGLIIAALAAWIVKMESDRKEARAEYSKTLQNITEKHEEVVKNIVEKHEEVVSDITEKHDKTIENIASKMDATQKDTNIVVRDQTNIVTRLTTLIETFKNEIKQR